MIAIFSAGSPCFTGSKNSHPYSSAYFLYIWELRAV
jgi:hypothetical protein